ncbi:unnamed protein product [Urochloa decumbens]|uniref:Uncharacterized protein n=1 Tax=Urochloa decumbens TaxID=240449 RepID=A0ABC9BFS6_9POAL
MLPSLSRQLLLASIQIKGKSRPLERLLNDAVKPSRHLRRHVIPPIPSHPFPEEMLVANAQQPPDNVRLAPVHLQPPLPLHAAELEDGAHHAGALLLRRERAPHERREPPQAPRRVLQHLLVPQAQHAPRPLRARRPVLPRVLPLWAQPVPALAVQLERLLEPAGFRRRRRRAAAGHDHAGVEVEQGDQRVLGVTGDVHDPAPVGPRGARREQGVREVRPEEARRRRRRRIAVAAGFLQEAEGVDGPDAVVGVAEEERVTAVERRVGGPARGGEAEGLEPGGAALGEAGDEDVGGGQVEAGVDLREALQGDLGEPEAAVMAEGREQGAMGPSGKGGDHIGEVGREHHAAAVVVWQGGLVAIARGHRRRLTFALLSGLLLLRWKRCHVTTRFFVCAPIRSHAK